MAAPRLTEEEVHEACAEIAAQGERPTVLNVYDRLGRGSLTTITKYFNSWKASDEAQAFGADDLPAVVKLPDELSGEGEDLMKRVWNVAKGLADSELEVQREALRQAEQASLKKVEEAFAFSEAQALKIERLEDDFRTIRAQLEEEFATRKKTESQLAGEEKTNVALSKDNERLRHEIEELRKQAASLEEANKAAQAERRQLQADHAEELKRKDGEIRKLDIQAGKLQSSLEALEKNREDAKAEAKRKDEELSKRLAELEKLRGKLESVQAELDAAKTERQAANKFASDAEKLVANLEGQLAVYRSLDRPASSGEEGARE